jgi:anti-anti-sigma factor
VSTVGDQAAAEAVGDVLVLRPANEHLKLDAAQAIAELLESPRYQAVRKVCVVLGRVRYVDSTAISLLVRIGAERQLRLAELSARIWTVFQNMNLLPLFQTHPTEADALAAFAAARR